MVVYSDKSGGSDHYRRANRFAKCKAQVAPVNDDSPQWWKDFMRDGVSRCLSICNKVSR